jgi:hypothetical protein
VTSAAEASLSRPWLAIALAGPPGQSRLALAPAGVTVIDVTSQHLPPVMINPLEPGAGYPVQAHADHLAGLFETAFGLPEPVAAAVRAGLRRSYADCGWDLRAGRAGPDAAAPPVVPCFAQLRHAIAAAATEFGYSEAMRASVAGFLASRLDVLWAGPAGRFLEGGHPADLSRLLRARVVMANGSVADDQAVSFLAGTLLLRVAELAGTAPGGHPCTNGRPSAGDRSFAGNRYAGPDGISGLTVVLESPAGLAGPGWFGRLLSSLRAAGADVLMPAGPASAPGSAAIRPTEPSVPGTGPARSSPRATRPAGHDFRGTYPAGPGYSGTRPASSGLWRNGAAEPGFPENRAARSGPFMATRPARTGNGTASGPDETPSRPGAAGVRLSGTMPSGSMPSGSMPSGTMPAGKGPAENEPAAAAALQTGESGSPLAGGGPGGQPLLAGRRSAACGQRCQRRPCTGYELHAAALLAGQESQAWPRLWLQALVIAFVAGRPVPRVPFPLRRAWAELSPRRRECVLADVIDRAVMARAPGLRPSYNPRSLMSAVAAVAARMLDSEDPVLFRAGQVWVIPPLRWLHEMERVHPFGQDTARPDDIAPPLDFGLAGLPDWPGIRVRDRISGLRQHSMSMESQHNRQLAATALLGEDGGASLYADLATAGTGLGSQLRLRHAARLMGAGGHGREPGWLEIVLSWPNRIIRPAWESDVRQTATG